MLHFWHISCDLVAHFADPYFYLSSGWVLVLQISDQIPGSFHYDSELWTNNDTLNAQYTNNVRR